MENFILLGKLDFYIYMYVYIIISFYNKLFNKKIFILNNKHNLNLNIIWKLLKIINHIIII